MSQTNRGPTPGPTAGDDARRGQPDDQRTRVLRTLAQHARTDQLLGADAVPAYRTPGGASEIPAPAVPAAESNDVTPAAPARAPAPASPPASPARREPPVVTTRATARSDRSADSFVRHVPPGPSAPAGPSTPVPAPAAGARPCPDIYSSPEQRFAWDLLEGVRLRYEHDAPHTNFVTSFNHIVFGDGDPRARVMFIGEAPGEEEDRTGRPFVGRAGQLLNEMIRAMGLTREGVYIANVLKTRPPNNATPTADEAALCAPYLYDQIAAVRPEAIVTLGLPATRLILQQEGSMASMRGRWWSYRHRTRTPDLIALVGAPGGEEEVPVMPTYHPAFLLRAYTKENRLKVWTDLKQVVERLGLTPLPRPTRENP